MINKTWAKSFCVAMSLAGVVHAQTAPTFDRDQRVARFNQFLAERKQALYNQGARRQTLPSQLGQPYPFAPLLDPRHVTNVHAYAINRYDSYQARIQAQSLNEDLKISPVIFGTQRPLGHISPEDFNGLAGTPGYDSTSELRQALNTGVPVWLTPGKTYMVSQVLDIPNHTRMASDGSATILVKTGVGTAFTSADTRTTLTDSFVRPPIQITGKNDIVLRDFRVRMASEIGDVQPRLKGGIQINSSTNVRVEGLEVLGFPRTLGILRINSSKGVTLQDNLIHGGYTVIPTCQVTGIEIDNDRVNNEHSSDIQVIGNFLFGVLLDNGLVFMTGTGCPGRSPHQALGYESDGINVHVNANPVLIANNSVMDVGEGIDTFASNGTYRNNHVERAFGFGLKLIHGASNNVFTGNRVLATGFSSIVVSDSTARPTGGNQFIRNRIRYTNAFNTETLPPWVIRPQRIGAIDLSGFTRRNLFVLNEVSEPMFQGAGYVSGVYCSWPRSSASDDANQFWKDNMHGFATIYHPADSPCIQAKMSGAHLRSAAYEDWTADGIRIESNVRHDFLGEHVTTDRLWANVSGNHEVRIARPLASWYGRHFAVTTLVRRGTNNQMMLRDQITDWYVVFDLSGNGSIISQSGSMVTGGSVVRLTDDWYQVSVRFTATQGSSLLTIRQLNSGANMFLDLGETRVEADE